MNRNDLQRLAGTRIREAKILFKAGEYSGSYYLAGYAVECALKACIAKSVKRYDFPDRKMSGKVFTHRLPELVALAALDDELLTARRTNGRFAAAWDVVSRWTEEARYFSPMTRADAEQLLDAIAQRKDGVLPWIRQRW